MERRTTQAPSQLSWPVISETESASVVFTKKSLVQRCGVERARVGCENNHATSASARVLRGQPVGSPRGAARGGREARRSIAMVSSVCSHSRRPGTVSVKKSLVQRCRVERARVGREDNHAKTTSARAPWAVGRLSTGRSARRPHATGLVTYVHDVLKPQPPTWRGVAEEESRPTAWVGARTALAAKTTTPSPPAHACAAWAADRLSMGRSARRPRGTGFGCCGHVVSQTQPPTWRGIGEEEPRPTVWGGVRPRWPRR